jgi:hypothetical protein
MLENMALFGIVKCLSLLQSVLALASVKYLYIKNGVFWDVTPCASCNNRRFGGT